MGITAEKNKEVKKYSNNIGFFISSISNLAEALNALRLDTDYALQQQKNNL